ncbi:ComEA family DNA-binding protein [Paraflavitalea pollutisoli]|uniref:ComEA family DNA-binding protein n=1 Tax=Paraflavitalea pollutisoli TaxID=3034143 RepID=UPI003B82CF32
MIPENDQSYSKALADRGDGRQTVNRYPAPEGTAGVARTVGSSYGGPRDNDRSRTRFRGSAPAIIDINAADTSAFIALWGIGSKLAARIVNFREKLGGFHGVEQVGETYGLPDSTFQAIRSHLQCAAPDLRTININTADADVLDQHPYISRSQAYAIVRYREQHGSYQAVDQLLQITILTPDNLEKMRPYLTVR